MLEGLANDDVSLVKADNSQQIDNIKALVQRTSIFIEDASLPIEEGDYLMRKLPNGLVERYLVLDRGFFGNFEGVEAHYQVKVQKEGTIRTNQNSTNITYNLHGNQSRVNVNSQDNSTNTYNQKNETVFNELRQAIQNNIKDDSKEIILAKLDELQQAKGTKSFVDRYRDFIDTAEKHISIIAPFIPALSQMLS